MPFIRSQELIALQVCVIADVVDNFYRDLVAVFWYVVLF